MREVLRHRKKEILESYANNHRLDMGAGQCVIYLAGYEYLFAGAEITQFLVEEALEK